MNWLDPAIATYIAGGATSAVGLTAVGIYLAKRRSERRNAAAIIVMDVRQAEQVVIGVSERQGVDRSLRPIIYENNWAKYKHLFADDFSYDDLAVFNRFFDACMEIADYRRRMHDVFYAALNAKAALLQEKIFEPDVEVQNSKEGKERQEALKARFDAETACFDPMDPRGMILKNIGLMGRPSQTLAFARLRKLAKMQ